MGTFVEYKNRHWLESLRVGSEDAFRELFDRYARKLFHFAQSYLKDSCEAEEIVQEVFIRIWSVREQLTDEKSFDSYIFTIAKNAILNTIRKSKSEEAFRTWAVMHPGQNVLLDDELDFNELQRAYRVSVEKLSPKRRVVFELSRDAGLSNAEIAGQLGISVKTVENQMTAAISEIRKHLGARGFSGKMYSVLFF